MYVISDTQTLFGSSTVNSRLSKLGKTFLLWLLSVVALNRFFCFASTPAISMTVFARYLPQVKP